MLKALGTGPRIQHIVGESSAEGLTAPVLVHPRRKGFKELNGYAELHAGKGGTACCTPRRASLNNGALEPIANPSSSRSDRLVRQQWCFRAYCDPICLAE